MTAVFYLTNNFDRKNKYKPKQNIFDRYGNNKNDCLTRVKVLTPRIIAITTVFCF